MNISDVTPRALVYIAISFIALILSFVLIYLYLANYLHPYLDLVGATLCVLIACVVTLRYTLKHPPVPILRYKDTIEFIVAIVLLLLFAPLLLQAMTVGFKNVDCWLSHGYTSDWYSHLRAVFSDQFIDGYIVNIFSSIIVAVIGYTCRDWIRRFIDGLIRPARLTVSLPLMISASPILRLQDQHELSRSGAALNFKWYFAGKSAFEQLGSGTDIAVVSDMALLIYLDNNASIKLTDFQYIPFCKITGHIKILEYSDDGSSEHTNTLKAGCLAHRSRAAGRKQRPDGIFHFEGSVHEDYLISHLKYTVDELAKMKGRNKLLVRSTLECVRQLTTKETGGTRGAVLAWEPHYVVLKKLHNFSEIDEKEVIPNGEASVPYVWTLCLVAMRKNLKVEKLKYEILVSLDEACRWCEKTKVGMVEQFEKYMPCELSGVTVDDLTALTITKGGNDSIVYGIEGATKALVKKLRDRNLGSAKEWAGILEGEKPWFGIELIK